MSKKDVESPTDPEKGQEVKPKELSGLEKTLASLKAKGKDVNSLISQVLPQRGNNTGLTVKAIVIDCLERPEGASIPEIALEVANSFSDGGLHLTTVRAWLSGNPVKLGLPVRKIGKGDRARFFLIKP